MLQTQDGQELEVDWLRYPDIPKQELVDHAATHGWRYSVQNYNGDSWFLTFTFAPSTPYEDASVRLTNELGAAEPDGTGRYALDPGRYSSLSDDRRREVIAAAGWEPASSGTGKDGLLQVTRPGLELSDGVTEPQLLGIRPQEFRQNPAVIRYAREIQQEHGNDPLAPETLDRLRQRNNYWLKRFLGSAALCGLLWATGPFPLFIGMQDDIGSDTAVQVGVWMMVAGTVFGGIAWWIRHRRKRDIGAHLKALRQLRRIHNDPRAASNRHDCEDRRLRRRMRPRARP
ncbi:hypothetical protein GCM10009676_22930 [Prauserella halophila]|uniref:DUF2812 domain-containing protein n=2 Tax=Prauserella halophila TaxID=185641 RepID=A0ABN1W6H6_9PSEU